MCNIRKINRKSELKPDAWTGDVLAAKDGERRTQTVANLKLAPEHALKLALS